MRSVFIAFAFVVVFAGESAKALAGPSVDYTITVGTDSIKVDGTVNGVAAADIDHVDITYYEIGANGVLTPVDTYTFINPKNNPTTKFTDLITDAKRKLFIKGKKYQATVNVYKTANPPLVPTLIVSQNFFFDVTV